MRGAASLDPRISFVRIILLGMEDMKIRNPLSALLCVCSFLFLLPLAAHAVQAEHNDSASTRITLQGDITGSQNNTYIQVPFRVPDGVERVTITFHYTERDKHTALDLGLMDTAGLRCWS